MPKMVIFGLPQDLEHPQEVTMMSLLKKRVLDSVEDL